MSLRYPKMCYCSINTHTFAHTHAHTYICMHAHVWGDLLLKILKYDVSE